MVIDFRRLTSTTKAWRPVDSGRVAPYALAVVAFGIYAVWSLTLQGEFQTTGFDLGIFEQAVRSYANGEWPTSDLIGPGYLLLGDHFHPILALLAPLYRLWPSADALLVAQAALLGLSVVPVTRCAVRALGTRRGWAVGAGYLFSWGLLSAVNFDFHEICFAVPLLAFAMERLLLRQWTAAVLIALPLVLVKEDLPMTLAALGFYLVSRGQRRLGWATAVFGVLATVLLVTVVLPALNVAGSYAHMGNLDHQGGLFEGAPLKLATIVLLFAPTGFVALRSPLSMLLLPTLTWRMTSGNSSYWGPTYHYSAVLMPIVFVAAVDGYGRLRSGARVRAYRWVPVCALIAGAWSLVFQLPPSSQPVWSAAQQVAAEETVSRIPDGATVAAANRLAPHLTSRCRVLLFPRYPSATTRPEWIALAKPELPWPVPVPQQEAFITELEQTSYTRVVDTATVVLLHRTSEPPVADGQP